MMKIDKSGPCSGCKKSNQIENRTKWLCPSCNHFRRHGETQQETAIRKQKEYQERSIEKQRKKEVLQKTLPPKPVKTYSIGSTKKEEKQKNQLSLLKKEIRQEAIDSDLYYCQGCGDGSQNLDCSHILSVRHRKDLELDKENINLFCRTCHEKWESNDAELMLELNSFVKDLNYIEKKDPSRFNRLLTKLHELHLAIKEGTIFDVNIKVILVLEKIIITKKFVTINN